MERRQQHGNADAPGQCIRRADEQRHSGVDHAALREGQVHTKVGGIGVAAAAGGAKLLVVQPGHGRSKCRQRRNDARLPQHPPVKMEPRLAADEAHAVAPAEDLEKQHVQRHIKCCLIAEQGFHDRIAEEARVRKNEHEAVYALLLLRHAQKLRHGEAQDDQRCIDRQNDPRQPQRLPVGEHMLAGQGRGKDLHGVGHVHDEAGELFVALHVHDLRLCRNEARRHAEKQDDHLLTQSGKVHMRPSQPQSGHAV